MSKKKSQNEDNKPLSKNGVTPLSQEELKAWWPFERLDPKRFPKQSKAPQPDPLEDAEEALL